MNKIIILETKHLYLREWEEDDFISYAKLTSNSEVMKFFPKLLTRVQSDAAAMKFQKLIKSRGWGFWVMEEKLTGNFIGYAGLHSPSTKFPFSPCVEIAWRVENEYWEKGYVLEAGESIVKFAFEIAGLDEIVYFSSIAHKRAESILPVLGFKKEKKSFAHPMVDCEHFLSEHYLYRLKKP
jgi:ribosomal-protein-alanine N-acetyltransferase